MTMGKRNFIDLPVIGVQHKTRLHYPLRSPLFQALLSRIYPSM
jgi:hypothetical protein